MKFLVRRPGNHVHFKLIKQHLNDLYIVTTNYAPHMHTLDLMATLYFSVCVNEERTISVEEGKNVTLEIDSEIQKDDQILWMFGAEEFLIAQIKGETRETHDVSDGGFRNRLKLEESGSLTISNITTEHTGAYKAQIISHGRTSYKKFKVVMIGKYLSFKMHMIIETNTNFY